MNRIEIGQRLKKLRDDLNFSRKEITELVNIGTTTLQQWEGGAREASIETIKKLAEIYNTTPQYIIFGDDDLSSNLPYTNQTHSNTGDPHSPTGNEYVSIPFYDIQASAGLGLFTEGAQAPSKHLAFRKRWVQARGLQANKLVALLTKGDSMEPTIQDGAVIIIDTTKTIPIDGNLYIIRVADNLLVKRTQWLFNGDLSLISDNKYYTPQTVSAEDMTEHGVQVCGQLIHTSHDL